MERHRLSRRAFTRGAVAVAAAVAGGGAAACAAQPAPPALPSQPGGPAPQPTARAYTYAGQGTVNTHWVETPGGGLVVLDVQRDLVHAREAVDAVRAVGRPVRAVLITHPHEDHYTGLGLFAEAFPDATSWASAATIESIRSDADGSQAEAQRTRGDLAPRRYAVPQRAFDTDATLDVDGLQIVTREMGEGEATNDTVFYVPSSGDLYVGDLVMNQVHAFLYQGATGAWLAALDRIDVVFPDARTVHPGHGASGSKADLFAAQREYLQTVRTIAAEEVARSGPTDAAHSAAVARINDRFPYVNPTARADIVSFGVDGLFTELGRTSSAPLR